MGASADRYREYLGPSSIIRRFDRCRILEQLEFTSWIGEKQSHLPIIVVLCTLSTPTLHPLTIHQKRRCGVFATALKPRQRRALNQPRRLSDELSGKLGDLFEI
jgi:hypothetical protein